MGMYSRIAHYGDRMLGCEGGDKACKT